jgi:hypothetical protein
MSSNMVNYNWQKRTDRNNKLDPNDFLYRYNSDKTARKLLSKKLNAIQTHPSRWVHEMDNEMLESISMMLKSEDETNINMAKDIVFKSKLNYNQIRYLVSNHCYVLSNDTPEPTTYFYAG